MKIMAISILLVFLAHSQITIANGFGSCGAVLSASKGFDPEVLKNDLFNHYHLYNEENRPRAYPPRPNNFEPFMGAKYSALGITLPDDEISRLNSEQPIVALAYRPRLGDLAIAENLNSTRTIQGRLLRIVKNTEAGERDWYILKLATFDPGAEEPSIIEVPLAYIKEAFYFNESRDPRASAAVRARASLIDRLKSEWPGAYHLDSFGEFSPIAQRVMVGLDTERLVEFLVRNQTYVLTMREAGPDKEVIAGQVIGTDESGNLLVNAIEGSGFRTVSVPLHVTLMKFLREDWRRIEELSEDG